MRRHAGAGRRARRVAAGLAVVGLVVLLATLRDDRGAGWNPPLAEPLLEIDVDPGITDLELSRAVRLRFPPPAPEAKAPAKPASAPEPQPPAAPEPELPVPPPPAPPETAGMPAPPAGTESAAAVSAPSPPQPATAAGDSSAAARAATDDSEQGVPNDAAEVAYLRPRVLVHPRVPEKVIAKRKIDDAVILQTLVGTDGRVHQVRVVRGIARCEECTQSAVEAAERFVYDAPPGDRDVWTAPFEIRFTYKR